MLQPAQTTPEASATQKAEAAAENVMTVAKDPRYARYLKMVQVVSRYSCCCFTVIKYVLVSFCALKSCLVCDRAFQ